MGELCATISPHAAEAPGGASQPMVRRRRMMLRGAGAGECDFERSGKGALEGSARVGGSGKRTDRAGTAAPCTGRKTPRPATSSRARGRGGKDGAAGRSAVVAAGTGTAVAVAGSELVVADRCRRSALAAQLADARDGEAVLRSAPGSRASSFPATVCAFFGSEPRAFGDEPASATGGGHVSLPASDSEPAHAAVKDSCLARSHMGSGESFSSE